MLFLQAIYYPGDSPKHSFKGIVRKICFLQEYINIIAISRFYAYYFQDWIGAKSVYYKVGKTFQYRFFIGVYSLQLNFFR
ncbi:hypothetical protein GCM10008934_16590 [Virgibacillus salarius]